MVVQNLYQQFPAKLRKFFEGKIYISDIAFMSLIARLRTFAQSHIPPLTQVQYNAIYAL